jgi:hypothetical protein
MVMGVQACKGGRYYYNTICMIHDGWARWRGAVAERSAGMRQLAGLSILCSSASRQTPKRSISIAGHPRPAWIMRPEDP